MPAFTRRIILKGAASLPALALTAPRIARAATTEVNFVEAVHNLGYIDLMSARRPAILKKRAFTSTCPRRW